MTDPPTPYEVREEPSFLEDSKMIHPDLQTFRRLVSAIRFILERAPYVRAKAMDPGGRYWLRVFDAHKTTNGLDVPELLVSYEIAKHPPPRGLIRLRHVRNPEDVEMGLHVDAEPF